MFYIYLFLHQKIMYVLIPYKLYILYLFFFTSKQHIICKEFKKYIL